MADWITGYPAYLAAISGHVRGETLKALAAELAEKVRGNVTIDWIVKESVRAKLRTMVKRILRKHGYPPDKF